MTHDTKSSDTVGRAPGQVLRQRVGPFSIDGILGAGGMGVVYRARDPEGRPAAVKAIHPHLATPEVAARFGREAEIRIDHPNIVRVIDAGADDDGTAWLALELLDGEPLSSVVARAPLGTADALDVALQVCRGLGAAHAAGVVHRDLKPANLFRARDGAIKILDFGIARLLGEQSNRFTATGNVLGTPSYLSPEQARGESSIDTRTDIWSLGVVLYELIAGKPPFDRTTALATVLAVIMEEPPPLDGVVACPREVAAVVERCLSKEPSLRWSSVELLAQALVAAGARRMEAVERVASALPTASAAVESSVATIPEGERRLVAILLAHGVTDRDAVRDAIVGYGGVMLPLLGQRVIGLFGGETWRGNELQAAAAAALAARVAAKRLAVASGRATWAAGGISGHALSAAEAGCQLDVDGVAIDADSARLLGDRFRRRPTTDDGFIELLAEHRGSFAPPALRAGRVVGREIEIAQLRDVVSNALSEGRAGVVSITGPAGMGKTTLRLEIEPIATELDTEARVLVGTADPRGGRHALSTFRSMLSRYHRHVSPEAAPLEQLGSDERLAAVHHIARAVTRDPSTAVFLSELVDARSSDSAELDLARSDPQLMADRIRLALIQWMGGLLDRGPLVLVAEDLQWADAMSVGLLEELVERFAARPLVICVTARPEVEETYPHLFAGRDVVRIVPRPLSSAHVGALAASLGGPPLATSELRALSDRTGGNPLFVEQIVLAMSELPESELRGGTWPLPLSVEAAIQSRLDHLPAGEKDLCKRAAVLARPFTLDDLRAAGGVGSGPLVESLVRRDILQRARVEGRPILRFRSVLVSEVAYRMIADVPLRELHLSVGSALARDEMPDPEEVATHLDRGGDATGAAQWYATAALASARLGDAPTAIRCADRALRLGVADERRFELHLARADVLSFQGRKGEQLVDLEAALSVAERSTDRVNVLSRQAVWLAESGFAERATELARRVVVDARELAEQPEVAAMALARAAIVLVYADRLDEARDVLVECDDIAERASILSRAFCASVEGFLAAARGDHGRRRDAFLIATGLHVEAGDLRRAGTAQSNLADAYNRVGAYPEAVAALEAAAEKCSLVGNLRGRGYALANLGYALAMRGETTEALIALDRAATLADASRDSRLSTMVLLYRARASIEANDLATAESVARLALDSADALGLLTARVLASSTLARAKAGLGDPTAALQLSARALELRDAAGSIEEDEGEVFLVHARVLQQLGRAAEADDVLQRGRSRVRFVARRIDDPYLRDSFLRRVEANRLLLEGDSARVSA